MIVKEYWDNTKDNGIFWLGSDVSILAHKSGFLKLEKTKEFYGEDLEKASKVLGVDIKDLIDIVRKFDPERAQSELEKFYKNIKEKEE